MKSINAIAMICLLFIGCNNPKTEEQKTDEQKTDSTTMDKQPSPAEFADSKYTEIGKKNLAALSSGDIDGWMSSFADNAVYVWNAGDSVAGKAAITAYWKKKKGGSDRFSYIQ